MFAFRSHTEEKPLNTTHCRICGDVWQMCVCDCLAQTTDNKQQTLISRMDGQVGEGHAATGQLADSEVSHTNTGNRRRTHSYLRALPETLSSRRETLGKKNEKGTF